MRWWNTCVAVFGLLLCASSLKAQTVQQSGSVTPGHAVKWTTTGVISDGGTASNGLLTSLGVTASGPGICQQSGPNTGAFNRICLTATATSGGISMTNVGGATGGFTFTLNGVTQGLATVTLPVTSGDIACFADSSGTLQDCGGSVGTPIFILATGQSNFVQAPSLAWSPAANAVVWNNTVGTDGSVGTAFVALSSTTINLPQKIASELALKYPDRQICLLNVSYGSQNISHWMVGASAPDAYANITANITAALAACAGGVTKIDFFLWWQGENQTSTPNLYPANFATVQARFQAETWFPASTPVVVFGLAPTSISSDLLSDYRNTLVQAAVRQNLTTQRFIYTGALGASYWDGTVHPNAAGYAAVGEIGARAIIYGETNNAAFDSVALGTIAGSYAWPGLRNLVLGGDLTVNPWTYGTSFSSAANGTTFLNNFTWLQSGVGVVDITKASDAPTIAQTGMYTGHSIKVDVTTADTSIGGTDYYGIRYDVDAQTSSFLGFGQTGAKYATVSFCVKATVTGNYFVAVENSAQNRSYTTAYVVTASDTWECGKQAVIPGDTSGTWLYGSGVGLRVFWTVASSDTYLFTPDVWNTGDVRVGSATRANGMSSTANNFQLALIQVEKGPDSSVFDRTPFFPTLFGGTTGTGATVLQSSPTILTSLGVTGTIIGTSVGSNAFAIGPTGATNPAFQVDPSTASSITGLKVTSQASGNGLNIEVLGSTNEPLIINAKGSGTISLGTASTGGINLYRDTNFQAKGIDNAVIGASTPLAGTFTTLTATSASGLTLSSNSTPTATFGSSGSVSAKILATGTAGVIDLFNGGGRMARFNGAASLVNYLDVTAAATGGGVLFKAVGGDTDVAINFSSFGAGAVGFLTNNASIFQLQVLHTASATRYLTITGSNGGNPTISTSAGNVAFGASISTTTTDATSVSTGAIQNTGGMSVNKRVWMDGLTAASGTPTSICRNANEITVNAALTCTVSSLIFKHDVALLEKAALPTLMAIRPASFFYNDAENYGRERFGFVAEWMADLDRRLADGFDETGHARSIDQNAILAVVVKSLQELKIEVENLKKAK